LVTAIKQGVERSMNRMTPEAEGSPFAMPLLITENRGYPWALIGISPAFVEDASLG
jgi:hypothetical protein